MKNYEEIVLYGVKKTDGMITINVKIFDIETNIDVFVVDNKDINYDFLVGLDCIKKFKLRQNEKLEITQKIIPENTGETLNNIKYESEKKENKINFNEHVNVDNFEISVNHLDSTEKAGIDSLIDKYKTIFSKDKYDIGTVKDYEVRIDLLIDKYCNKRPYSEVHTSRQERNRTTNFKIIKNKSNRRVI